MRPDGIGRSGSLMASTCRSYQSFTAWLVPQTIGPARRTPATISGQRCPGETPDETIPQPSAHIGGNQVMGFNSSRTTEGDGRWATALFIFALFIWRVLGEPESAKLDVKALSAEAEHFGGRGAVIASQLQRSLDGQLLDHVGGLAHKIAQWYSTNEFGQLRHRARKLAR